MWWMIMAFGVGLLNAGRELCMSTLKFECNCIGRVKDSIAQHTVIRLRF